MRWSCATSASRGTLSRISVCSDSRPAIIKGNAAFFAPEIGMVPLSLLPPTMRIRSMPPPACLPYIKSIGQTVLRQKLENFRLSDGSILLFEHDLRANASGVCREGTPAPIFPDHALNAIDILALQHRLRITIPR